MKYRYLGIQLPQLLGAWPLCHRPSVPLLASFTSHLHDIGSVLPLPLPTSLCSCAVSPLHCLLPQFIAQVTPPLTWMCYLNAMEQTDKFLKLALKEVIPPFYPPHLSYSSLMSCQTYSLNLPRSSPDHSLPMDHLRVSSTHTHSPGFVPSSHQCPSHGPAVVS